MSEFMKIIKGDKVKQIISFIIIFLSPLILYVFNNSAIAFLLFLLSLFLLYKAKMNTIVKFAVIAVDLLLIVPMIGIENSYYLDVITQVGIYAVLAMGLNVVVGFSGLLDLGYVGFYASGAYVYAIFASSQANNFVPKSWAHFPISGVWFWPFLLISMAVAAVVGVLLGLPVLRLKGDYLAIVTLGFGEIIRIILNNMDKPINISNGPKGIAPVQPPELFGITFNTPIHFYFIVLCIFILTLVIVSRLNNSRIGRAWAAIREDEVAARTMGIPLVKMKLLAFATGASFAGMMGVVFAAKQTFIDPSSFGFMESIGILAMVLMGGIGNITGVIFGAMAVVTLQLHILKEFSNFLRDLSTSGIINIPSQLDPAKYERMVFGLILVLMCIFRPKGFLPVQRSLNAFKDRMKNIRKKEEKADIT